MFDKDLNIFVNHHQLVSYIRTIMVFFYLETLGSTLNSLARDLPLTVQKLKKVLPFAKMITKEICYMGFF